MKSFKSSTVVLIATALLITSVLAAPIEDTTTQDTSEVRADTNNYQPTEIGLPSMDISTEPTSFKNTSTFSCNNKITGYYADVKLGCRVYHFCAPMDTITETRYQRMSYMCLEGSVFDQKDLNCVKESELKVPCDKAEEEYEKSNKQFDKEEAQPSMSDNLAANLMMNPLTRFIAGR